MPDVDEIGGLRVVLAPNVDKGVDGQLGHRQLKVISLAKEHVNDNGHEEGDEDLNNEEITTLQSSY